MKKHLLSLACIICCSCLRIISEPKAEQIDKFDDFTGQRIRSFEKKYNSTEHYSPINYINVYAVNQQDKSLYITMFMSAEAFSPEPYIWAKTDKELLKWPLWKIEKSKFQHEEKITTKEWRDSVFVDKISVSYTDTFIQKAEIRLTDEAIQKILETGFLSLRINTGSKPNTFVITDLSGFKNVFR